MARRPTLGFTSSEDKVALDLRVLYCEVYQLVLIGKIYAVKKELAVHPGF
jgi:hypothetical protein